uniref:ELMO domain-containing protein n=1 Tax=Brassica oleracea TaxID=3712 RepID=A0A3P6GX40_BRAOL|nr:unnamed protein product [Brassica oleracea]
MVLSPPPKITSFSSSSNVDHVFSRFDSDLDLSQVTKGIQSRSLHLLSLDSKMIPICFTEDRWFEPLHLQESLLLPLAVSSHRFHLSAENQSAFDLLYCIAFKLMDQQWLSMCASYMEFNGTCHPAIERGKGSGNSRVGLRKKIHCFPILSSRRSLGDLNQDRIPICSRSLHTVLSCHPSFSADSLPNELLVSHYYFEVITLTSFGAPGTMNHLNILD